MIVGLFKSAEEEDSVEEPFGFSASSTLSAAFWTFFSTWCFIVSATWFVSDCGGGAGSAVELQEDNAMLKRENRGM
ncbi:hypothetical protein [Candidatus Liberibacter solanacearum]|uniref:hypothetical protein n=1 Tax=Candidatus Liberibacter solanacearum TaxID=556287 RepID=UPI00387122FE